MLSQDTKIFIYELYFSIVNKIINANCANLCQYTYISTQQ